MQTSVDNIALSSKTVHIVDTDRKWIFIDFFAGGNILSPLSDNIVEISLSIYFVGLLSIIELFKTIFQLFSSFHHLTDEMAFNECFLTFSATEESKWDGGKKKFMMKWTFTVLSFIISGMMVVEREKDDDGEWSFKAK